MFVRIRCPLVSNASFDIFCVGTGNTIRYLKEMIIQHHLPKLEKDNFDLLFRNRMLVDEMTLEEADIQDWDVLVLALKLRTGI
jgi:hypothetical protein